MPVLCSFKKDFMKGMSQSPECGGVPANPEQTGEVNANSSGLVTVGGQFQEVRC